MKLIGLVGRAEAGKTTIANHLVEHFGYARTAFADPLKKMLITAGLCTHDECYKKKTEQSRFLLQRIGTEIFRKQIDPLFWVDRCEQEIYRLGQQKPVVVDDIRFPEEARRIRDLGGVLVKVERVGHNAATGTDHDSESQVDGIATDFTIRAESGDVQKIYLCIEEIIGERL